MSVLVTVPTIDTVTRHKYERLQYTGSAGVVASLEDARLVDRWRADYPGWDGEHWAFDAGTDSPGRLRPINVAVRNNN
ncbi:hypothetical protein [Nocardia fluminea]|uniref:Uncharacterized protein n=2 Tax=Nocardiaceae TaxID=85025 RepID=A0A2N3V766_9NOCA|nr:hypothetical protein [Nocardia fluminea]PKV77459.1 hypothetical protein ATK86_1800 [Nocardia fluminea]